MHSKIVIILVLIVVLPLGLLGWLGLRLAGNEQQMLQHRFQALANAQLRAVDAAIQAYFKTREDELLAVVQRLEDNTDAIRAYTRNEPRVRQTLLMEPDGERLHPPLNSTLTQGEQRLLERTGDFWRDKDILYQTGAGATDRQSGTSSIEAESEHGWYVWYWGRETNLIFWRRDAQRRLWGFELEPVRVLADLVSILPATGETADHTDQSRIRLLDGRGSVAYQWGRFQPQEGQPVLAVLPLSHPLGNWKLVYLAPPLQGQDRYRWVLSAVLAALAITLAGLAFYLYREHTREARSARRRVNFVNQVSHELKTPLTNIRMYAELLEAKIPEDEDRCRRYLGVILAESQRLSRLIANVLNFARQQRDSLRLRTQTGSVDQVVSGVLAAFRPALESKGMRVEFQAGAGRVVSLDPDVVEQILNNLLSNVEKYAAEGKRVQVETRQQGKQTLIAIRDWGPGIPQRERERIFQAFYRVSSRLNEGVSGTGIGLGITRDLARLHGGDLCLLPTEQGACFQVTLETPVIGGSA